MILDANVRFRTVGLQPPKEGCFNNQVLHLSRFCCVNGITVPADNCGFVLYEYLRQNRQFSSKYRALENMPDIPRLMRSYFELSEIRSSVMIRLTLL